MTVTIRPALAKDLDTTVRLLHEAGLPTEDVTVERLSFVAEKGSELQGVIGMESFVAIALLRSLVVSKEARSAGIGLALVSALESTCIADGVKELWLLTIDADRFFLKLGYVVRGREEAPESIRSTEEFSSLCPGDAILMSKPLRPIPIP